MKIHGIKWQKKLLFITTFQVTTIKGLSPPCSVSLAEASHRTARGILLQAAGAAVRAEPPGGAAAPSLLCGDVCSQLTPHSLALLSKKKLSNSNIEYHVKIPKVNIIQPVRVQTLPTFSSC